MLAFNPQVMNTLTRNWWLMVVRGIAGLIFAALAVFYPGEALGSLVSLFALYVLIDGVFALVAAVRLGEACAPWVLSVIAGGISIVLGLLAFLYPGLPAVTLLVLVALWSILHGLVEGVAALQLQRRFSNEWVLGLAALLTLALGVFLLLYPFRSAQVLIWVLGFYAAVYGALQLAFAHRLHHYRAMPVNAGEGAARS